MTTIVFDVNAFVAQYPAFSDGDKFPTALLDSYFDTASCFISTNDYGYLHGACRVQALYLMTAHIAQLGVIIASGQSLALINSTTIDKVSVSLTPPPVKNQLQWWLNLTPYGAQLYALLTVVGVGGLYIGGSPQSAGFRKSNGFFC